MPFRDISNTLPQFRQLLDEAITGVSDLLTPSVAGLQLSEVERAARGEPVSTGTFATRGQALGRIGQDLAGGREISAPETARGPTEQQFSGADEQPEEFGDAFYRLAFDRPLMSQDEFLQAKGDMARLKSQGNAQEVLEENPEQAQQIALAHITQELDLPFSDQPSPMLGAVSTSLFAGATLGLTSRARGQISRALLAHNGLIPPNELSDAEQDILMDVRDRNIPKSKAINSVKGMLGGQDARRILEAAAGPEGARSGQVSPLGRIPEWVPLVGGGGLTEFAGEIGGGVLTGGLAARGGGALLARAGNRLLQSGIASNSAAVERLASFANQSSNIAARVEAIPVAGKVARSALPATAGAGGAYAATYTQVLNETGDPHLASQAGRIGAALGGGIPLTAGGLSGLGEGAAIGGQAAFKGLWKNSASFRANAAALAMKNARLRPVGNQTYIRTETGEQLAGARDAGGRAPDESTVIMGEIHEGSSYEDFLTAGAGRGNVAEPIKKSRDKIGHSNVANIDVGRDDASTTIRKAMEEDIERWAVDIQRFAEEETPVFFETMPDVATEADARAYTTLGRTVEQADEVRRHAENGTLDEFIDNWQGQADQVDILTNGDTRRHAYATHSQEWKRVNTEVPGVNRLIDPQTGDEVAVELAIPERVGQERQSIKAKGMDEKIEILERRVDDTTIELVEKETDRVLFEGAQPDEFAEAAWKWAVLNNMDNQSPETIIMTFLNADKAGDISLTGKGVESGKITNLRTSAEPEATRILTEQFRNVDMPDVKPSDEMMNALIDNTRELLYNQGAGKEGEFVVGGKRIQKHAERLRERAQTDADVTTLSHAQIKEQMARDGVRQAQVLRGLNLKARMATKLPRGVYDTISEALNEDVRNIGDEGAQRSQLAQALEEIPLHIPESEALIRNITRAGYNAGGKIRLASLGIDHLDQFSNVMGQWGMGDVLTLARTGDGVGQRYMQHVLNDYIMPVAQKADEVRAKHPNWQVSEFIRRVEGVAESRSLDLRRGVVEAIEREGGELGNFDNMSRSQQREVAESYLEDQLVRKGDVEPLARKIVNQSEINVGEFRMFKDPEHSIEYGVNQGILKPGEDVLALRLHEFAASQRPLLSLTEFKTANFINDVTYIPRWVEKELDSIDLSARIRGSIKPREEGGAFFRSMFRDKRTADEISDTRLVDRLYGYTRANTKDLLFGPLADMVDSRLVRAGGVDEGTLNFIRGWFEENLKGYKPHMLDKSAKRTMVNAAKMMDAMFGGQRWQQVADRVVGDQPVSELANQLQGLQYASALWGSLSTTIKNFSQGPMFTTAEFGPHRALKGFAAMLNEVKQPRGDFNRFIRSSVMSSYLDELSSGISRMFLGNGFTQRALREMAESESGAARQAADVGLAGSEGSRAFMEFGNRPFEWAEIANRMQTFWGAMDYYRAKGLTPQEALSKSIFDTTSIQFDYTRFGRPAFTGTPVGRVMMPYSFAPRFWGRLRTIMRDGEMTRPQKFAKMTGYLSVLYSMDLMSMKLLGVDTTVGLDSVLPDEFNIPNLNKPIPAMGINFALGMAYGDDRAKERAGEQAVQMFNPVHWKGIRQFTTMLDEVNTGGRRITDSGSVLNTKPVNSITSIGTSLLSQDPVIYADARDRNNLMYNVINNLDVPMVSTMLDPDTDKSGYWRAVANGWARGKIQPAEGHNPVERVMNFMSSGATRDSGLETLFPYAPMNESDFGGISIRQAAAELEVDNERLAALGESYTYAQTALYWEKLNDREGAVPDGLVERWRNSVVEGAPDGANTVLSTDGGRTKTIKEFLREQDEEGGITAHNMLRMTEQTKDVLGARAVKGERKFEADKAFNEKWKRALKSPYRQGRLLKFILNGIGTGVPGAYSLENISAKSAQGQINRQRAMSTRKRLVKFVEDVGIKQRLENLPDRLNRAEYIEAIQSNPAYSDRAATEIEERIWDLALDH